MTSLTVKVIVAIIVLLVVAVGFWQLKDRTTQPSNTESAATQSAQQALAQEENFHPISIPAMRKKDYPGSEFTIEETLPKGSNYNRYIATHVSDGHKIYGLLTIPTAEKPAGGFPAIVFLHGYLAPETYQTLERYVAYQDGFARSGYVTFKSDLRGHGRSEGEDVAASFADGYITDALNVAASFKKHPDVNPQKIGMWGHSMGGGITLRSMVVSKDIKAGVIWAGVVANYPDIFERYATRRRTSSSLSSSRSVSLYGEFLEKYGSPSANPKFWNAVDPYTYLAETSGPIQLHHGTNDESVPWEYSESLKNALEKVGKPVEYYIYEGADHNLSGAAFTQSMQRSIAFFDKYLR